MLKAVAMPPAVASPGRHAWGWGRNHCGLLVGCAGREGMALIGVIRGIMSR